MSIPSPSAGPNAEGKRQLVVGTDGGMATAPSCQRPIADRRICGCLNPPDRESDVSVISSDLAVRRSLVLMLEADGVMARGYCAVPPFLAALNAARLTHRHCVVIEKGPAHNNDQEGLASLIPHMDRPLSIVVLVADLPRIRPPPAATGAIFYVDPFAADDVLRAIKNALAAP